MKTQRRNVITHHRYQVQKRTDMAWHKASGNIAMNLARIELEISAVLQAGARVGATNLGADSAEQDTFECVECVQLALCTRLLSTMPPAPPLPRRMMTPVASANGCLNNRARCSVRTHPRSCYDFVLVKHTIAFVPPPC